MLDSIVETVVGPVVVVMVLGGPFGIPYLAVVALVKLAVVVLAKQLGRTIDPVPTDLVVVPLPIATYLVLTWLVEERQGLNWYLANLVVAMPVSAALVAYPWLPRDWVPAWAIAVTLTGIGAAWWAWQNIPSEPVLSQLF